ncbi:hypothetical protein [Streptomyces roseicoloratus]|uniref:Integral membrane protein n=1 Tax=Streptomyces roseicoloratus TaxID=2508722 RepID=A0ABY9RX09_9ACTN|nr:hypothetical protein [Streptomyces roseicoloratus]WMX45435.1 hypothetical protein RGF97_12040 [Streptomyces roseicoloratus]
MSFGDPNNPYGQQQGQQPGYGHPQQSPQGVPPQQGYGYPAAPAYGGGYPGAPMEMPGGVKAARVMLWVIAGLQVIGLALLVLGLAAVQKLKDDPSLKADSNFDAVTKFGTGMIYALIVLAILFLAGAIWGAIQCGKGGSGARVGLIVLSSLTIVFSLYPWFPLSLIHLVLAILVLVFVAKSDGAAWFKRPRV